MDTGKQSYRGGEEGAEGALEQVRGKMDKMEKRQIPAVCKGTQCPGPAVSLHNCEQKALAAKKWSLPGCHDTPD